MDLSFKEKVQQRILRSVEIISESGCWVWMDCLAKTRYGNVRFKPEKDILAHRWAYKAFVGEIPNGMHVLHRCDVRECVNPNHLFCGTNVENIIDSMKKGRRKGITRRRPSGLIYKNSASRVVEECIL